MTPCLAGTYHAGSIACIMVGVPLVAVEWVAYGYNIAFASSPAIAFAAGKNPDGHWLF